MNGKDVEREMWSKLKCPLCGSSNIKQIDKGHWHCEECKQFFDSFVG